MNTIRENFKEQVDALLPVLHAAYRAIGRYQKSRTDRNRGRLLEHLALAGEALRFFKRLVPRKKQPYFDAVLDESLSASDRVIALDVAVGAMHIEFAVPRAYMHREGEALRRALEEARWTVDDDVVRPGDSSRDVLLRGIAASPGAAIGRAAIIRRTSDYRRLSSGSIVVARMTRTDMMLGIEKIAGIVTDIGGSLCHAAVVAREIGIPCVVGTGHATQSIRPRQLLSVDGDSGVVRRILPGGTSA